jgi:hypothetical protein
LLYVAVVVVADDFCFIKSMVFNAPASYVIFLCHLKTIKK